MIMLHAIQQLAVNRQLCFIHIPKTAGSSFVDTIKDAIPKCSRLFYSKTARETFSNYAPGELEGINPLVICGHYSLAEMKQIAPSNAVFLSITRGPAERLLSYYQFARRTTNRNEVSDAARNLEFYAFVKFLERERRWIIDNQQCRFVSDSIGLKNNGRVEFEKIRQGVDKHPYLIAPIEKCDEIFNRVARALELESIEFLRKKVTVKKNEIPIDQDCLDLIRKYNREDALLYEHSVKKMNALEAVV
jgi:hypothetical protein